MKPHSCKQKGRKLQQLVRDLILSVFPELDCDDVRSTAMGQGGEDVQLSPRARELMPYAIECKWVERLNVYQAYEQARNHKGTHEPLLIMKKNHKEVLAVISAEHLLKLIRGNGDGRNRVQEEAGRTSAGSDSND